MCEGKSGKDKGQSKGKGEMAKGGETTAKSAKNPDTETAAKAPEHEREGPDRQGLRFWSFGISLLIGHWDLGIGHSLPRPTLCLGGKSLSRSLGRLLPFDFRSSRL
jgi:hypothetical protein